MQKIKPLSQSISSSQQSPLVNSTAQTTSDTGIKLSSTNKKSKKFKLWPSSKKKQYLMIFFLILGVLLGVVGVIGAYTYQITTQTIDHYHALSWSGSQAYQAFKQQNLPQIKTHLGDAQSALEKINEQYSKLGFYQHLPFANRYYSDVGEVLIAGKNGLDAASISIEAITPYADVLGFEGEGTFEGGTTEDRVGVILQTLDKISPQLDEIQGKLEQVNSSLAKIDANRYPEQIGSTPVRSKIHDAQQAVDQSISLFSEFRPVIEQLPNIAGSQGQRKKYLVLFQNNNELRPTGGFLTAYSIIFIENGKVTPDKSDDIYELDKKFRSRLEIPEQLGKYLTTEKYWNLRDMNISPDFKISMDTFFKHYQTVRGEPQDVDGIITVDTQLLTKLLEVLGPVEVPGYGTFSAQNDPRCDCPQVVYALSEIITKPTPFIREDRKGILGPMMSAILHKTYSAPRQHWPQLFSLAWEAVQSRSVQMYYLDQEAQQAAENANAAGRMNLPNEGDFLAIVDANLGGAKSNLFTEYEVTQIVEGPTNGSISNNLEITYRNSHKADNCNLEAGKLCLNAPAPTWNRIYLPPSVEVLETQGYLQEPSIYQEEGFTVVDGFYRLDPLGMSKIKIRYQQPFGLDHYQVSIWKQGGIKPFSFLLDVNGNQQQHQVSKDMVLSDTF